MNLSESYKDFNSNKATIRDYIKRLNDSDKLKNCKSADQLSDFLNDYFQPLGVSFVQGDTWGDEHWKDNYIQSGSTYEDGSIVVYADLEENVLDCLDSKYSLQEFINSLEETIMHELTHQIQFGKYRNRNAYNVEQITPRTYYSNKDEIAAHAQEAIEQLLNIGYDKEKILKRLTTVTRDAENNEGLVFESNAAWHYWCEFGEWDSNDKVWREFVEKMADFAEDL